MKTITTDSIGHITKPPSTKHKLKESNPVIVVSAGDSLTQATFSSDYLSILRRRLKSQHYEFVNAGQLGDNSENLLKRIDKDVLARNPNFITGQYTHAAVWLIMAFAKLGNNNRVWELLNIINPINHGKTAEEITIYKVEPYVLAADVYACTPNAGRGGWTWYTGSAGWMYQLITKSFLGLQQEGDKLKLVPCVPAI